MGIVNVFSTAKIQELLASLSSTYAAPTGTDDRLQVAGVDVTPAQVGAATAAQGAKADAAYSAAPLMTNIVVNGDFSAGTTGWSVHPDATASTSSGACVLTASGAIQYMSYQLPSLTTVGRKYYFSMAAKQSAAAPITRPRVYLGTAKYGSTQSIVIWDNNTSQQRVTSVFTATIAGGYLSPYAYVEPGQTVTYDNILLIDLTATFGAGLEPTKAEMDVLLSRYPDSWFGGTVNDLTRWYDPLNRVGQGSPYNVIAPRQKGETWTDLDQTNGARKWVATGTTATSWVVTDGDTGWRNVASLLVNGWATGASSLYLRRLNGVTFLKSSSVGLTGASATLDAFMTLPTGFRCPNGDYGLVGVCSIPGAGTLLPINRGMSDVVMCSARGYVSTFSSWGTDEPWPTSLPGTPA